MGKNLKDRATHENSNLRRFTAIGVSIAALYSGYRLVAKNAQRQKLDLRGKVTLITGGSRGLGLALAKEFGNRGAQICICARDIEELERAREILSKKGVTAEIFACDVTKQDELESLVDRVVSRFRRIDVLVNNAGLIKVGPLQSMVNADFDEAMNLMFWGPFHLTMAVLPHMKKLAGGKIVNIASLGGRVSVPHLLPYSCAKFALVGLSSGLASELQSHNIDVLTVCPGLMRTGSYLHAEFKGEVENEFGWFSLLGNLPGFSVAADYAAEQIRKAVEIRKYNCTISLPAKILIGANSLAPELTQTLLGVVSSILPGSEMKGSVSGKTLNPKFGKLFQKITTLGRQAAQRLNESPTQ